ncbi:Uncharacterised protein [Shigella sonnei]|nr:Uncharacterised protein [Shigella sonnei]CSS54483.1 Uncharacterised protein [Shigella sonnei]
MCLEPFVCLCSHRREGKPTRQIVVAGAHEPGFLLQTLNDGFLYFARKTATGAKIHQMEARHIKTGG